MYVSLIQVVAGAMTGACSAPGLLDFVNASPTPYNLVSFAGNKLKSKGFVELKVEAPPQSCRLLRAADPNTPPSSPSPPNPT